MSSKSFDMQENQEASHLVDGNDRCLPDGRKGMQSLGKIEDVKKKIYPRARKML